MWTEERCPTCGKVKQATWWNPSVNGAAPIGPLYSVPLSTAGPDVFTPDGGWTTNTDFRALYPQGLLNAAAAAPDPCAVTTFALCTCC